MARRGVVKIIENDYKVGDVVKVQAVIIHPMDTGYQKDKHSGQLKPKFYVETITAYFDDKEIAKFDMGVSASANPKIIFPYKVTGAGTIKVVFENNKGEKNRKDPKSNA
jgi:sulfur-oxidizing protein SoxZ